MLRIAIFFVDILISNDNILYIGKKINIIISLPHSWGFKNKKKEKKMTILEEVNYTSYILNNEVNGFVDFIAEELVNTNKFDYIRETVWNTLASDFVDNSEDCEKIREEIDYDYENIINYMTEEQIEDFMLTYKSELDFYFKENTYVDSSLLGSENGDFYKYIDKFYTGEGLNYEELKESLISDKEINLDNDFFEKFDSRVQEIEKIENELNCLEELMQHNKSTFKP